MNKPINIKWNDTGYGFSVNESLTSWAHQTMADGRPGLCHDYLILDVWKHKYDGEPIKVNLLLFDTRTQQPVMELGNLSTEQAAVKLDIFKLRNNIK